ncbi:MAG: hypothetical protein JNK64_18050 [Myxococcales bacterium]|nr:hypothetical protein [Myxococcales bacterium]
MISTRLAPIRWLTPLALAATLASGCTPPPPPTAPRPTAAATHAPAAPGVELTIFTGFVGAPTRPPALPRFAPLDDVFAACPAVRAAATVTLPRAATAATTLALPDGGLAEVRWEDPTKLRLRITGVPRARPGATLTYQLIATGRSVLFWGATGAPAPAAPCAYVVVGDGAPDHARVGSGQ